MGPNSIKSLTLDNLIINSINDQNVSKFFTNIIQRGEDDIDVGESLGESYTDLKLTDRLDIDNLKSQSNYATPN